MLRDDSDLRKGYEQDTDVLFNEFGINKPFVSSIKLIKTADSFLGDLNNSCKTKEKIYKDGTKRQARDIGHFNDVFSNFAYILNAGKTQKPHLSKKEEQLYYFLMDIIVSIRTF